MRSFKKTKRKTFKQRGALSLGLFLGISYIIFSHPCFASAALDNSYVIQDSRFVASGTMSEQDIQNFLVSKGSYLANYTVPAERYVNWHGVNYFEGTWVGPVGQEVNAQGWSAAHLIYMVSQWYGINPQVIIATIQKESSLITSSSPSFYGLVQWSMGYAYTEGGILNVCRTATNHNPSGSCAGFAMQVDWAGGGLKSWMTWANNRDSRAGQYYTGNTISIDGRSIYLGNGATAALYRYTPHIQTSFYNLFSLWFSIDRVIASNGDPRQWIVDYAIGTRQYIPNEDTINAWDLNNNAPLRTMDDRILGCYRDMTQPLGRIVRPGGTLAIYYANGGRKYPIASNEALSAWGLSLSNVADTTAGTGGLIRTTNVVTFLGDDLKQWLIDFTVNTKYHIPSPTIGSAWGISTDPGNQNDNAPTVNLSSNVFSGITQGTDLNRLVRATGGLSVYFNDNGKRQKVLSPEMMSVWGFNDSSILNLSSHIVDVPTQTGDLSYTVKNPSTNTIYMADSIDGNNKIVLRSYEGPDVLSAWEGPQVINTEISQEYFNNSMSVSADPLGTTKISYSGSEYQVLSAQKLLMSDNAAHLYPGVAESISNATFNRLIPSASVSQFVRSYDSQDVYLVDNLKKHKVSDPNILRAWGIGPNPATNVVNNGYINLIPTDNGLDTYEADVGGQLYLMDGRKISVPPGLDSAYRTVGDVYYPSSYLMNLLPTGENASNLLKGFQTLPVYLMDSGTIRHIRTPESLLLLKENDESITSVSQYTLSQFSQSGFASHFITNGDTKYVILAGIKYSVPDSLLSEWDLGYLTTVTQNTIDRYSGSSALTILVRDSAGKIYLINQNQKKHILGPTIYQSWGFTEENVVINTPDVLLNTILTGNNINVLVKSSESPDIYLMENGLKRHILSLEALIANGYNPSMISIVSQALIDSYNSGSPLG